MKKIIILTLLAGIVYSASSQQLQPGWVSQAGGPGWDVVTGMAELSNGQIVIAGAFYGSISFPTTKLESNGSRDVFIASYNPDGTFNRVISLGGQGYDYIKRIKPSGKSGVAIPIRFNQAIRVGGQEFKGQCLNNTLLAWLDDDLNLSQYTQIGSNGGFDITTLDTASGGGFYFSGWFSDTLLVDGKEYISKGSEDIFIGKTSGEGKIKWVNHYGGEKKDKACSFQAEGSGANFIAGTTYKGCFGSKTPAESTPDGATTFFITELNDAGEEVAADYPFYGTSFEPVQIIKDSTTLWALSNFKYSVRLKNGIELSSYGKSDALILKYDTHSQEISYYQLGGIGNDIASGMSLSGSQLVVTGHFTGGFTFGGNKVEAQPFGTDIFIASLDKNCSPTGISTFSGNNNGFPCAILASGAGIYIAGEFKDTLTIGNNKIISKGKEDIFLARVENCNAKNPLNVTARQLGLTTPDDSWELDAGPGYASYTWDGNETNTRAYTVTGNETHTIVVTDSLGCIYSGEINPGSEKSAKIEKEGQPGQEFSIYPSITSGKVYWQPSSEWGDATALVTVTDISGRKVYQKETSKLTNSTYQIDLSGEAGGAYVFEISGSNFRETSKIIVKK